VNAQRKERENMDDLILTESDLEFLHQLKIKADDVRYELDGDSDSKGFSREFCSESAE